MLDVLQGRHFSGDCLVCYVTRLSRWVGLLDVVTGPKSGEKPSIFIVKSNQTSVRGRNQTWLQANLGEMNSSYLQVPLGEITPPLALHVIQRRCKDQTRLSMNPKKLKPFRQCGQESSTLNADQTQKNLARQIEFDRNRG